MNDVKREESKRVSSFKMTAVKNKLSSNQKMEFIQAQKKLLLTSRVGELVGPTVGLDDGCSEDRNEIPV